MWGALVFALIYVNTYTSDVPHMYNVMLTHQITHSPNWVYILGESKSIYSEPPRHLWYVGRVYHTTQE